MIGTKNTLLIEGIVALVIGILHLAHLKAVKIQAKQANIIKEAIAVDAA
jgi:hypothetical protein